MSKNLFNKIWDSHKIASLNSGQDQIFIDLHLIHEVTSPQAFGMLRALGLKIAYPQRTFATVDHIIPTSTLKRPYQDSLAEAMIVAIKENCEEFNIKYFSPEEGSQGIVHVIGPEKGLTQPGTTIVCGDSHTSTHGAFGAIAFGIGTSQVRDVLATQSLALGRLKVRRININGKLAAGVYSKDVILHIIRVLGVKGGMGFAYEYGGSVIDAMSMEERMTICNMSIEGGARVGYINPDQITFDYLQGREYAPAGEKWNEAVTKWKSLASEADAEYDDIVNIQAESISPTLTWGINPGQAMSIGEKIPTLEQIKEEDQGTFEEALEYMKLEAEKPMVGLKINVAFIGSCTNGRLSDLEEVAKYVKGFKVSSNVKALIVPGSMQVKREAESKGLNKIFEEAGFEWREAGCSMCLAMNPDKLQADEICASSSNRNFKGRQGSPQGRTILMSPVMVAAAAIKGEVTDARQLFKI